MAELVAHSGSSGGVEDLSFVVSAEDTFLSTQAPVVAAKMPSQAAATAPSREAAVISPPLRKVPSSYRATIQYAAALLNRARTCEARCQEYQNVVGGRLKLKGKVLDVKEGGFKKKKQQQHREESSQIGHDALHGGGSSELQTDHNNELSEGDKTGEEEGNPHPHYDHLTPAKLHYVEQKQKIGMQKMAKVANKSHRDRIQDFNQ